MKTTLLFFLLTISAHNAMIATHKNPSIPQPILKTKQIQRLKILLDHLKSIDYEPEISFSPCLLKTEIIGHEKLHFVLLEEDFWKTLSY